MKLRNIISFISFLLFGLFVPISKTYASEIINTFNADIIVNTVGTVDISEKITYDFGTSEKHGILRKIPVTKTNMDGEVYKMNFTRIDVKGLSEESLIFKTFSDKNDLTIQVGDPNKLVTGINNYKILYKVSGAVTYFTDHDEFYWNITGDKNEIPISVASAEISLPFKVTELGEVKAECFTGTKGGVQKNCVVNSVANKVTVTTTYGLNSREGLTVVVSFPKGAVDVIEPIKIPNIEYSLIQKIVMFVVGAFVVAGLFLWFIFYPIKILVKWARGNKNIKSKQRVVAAWFESPETLNDRSLTPAETGALVDMNVDHMDVSATIIDLAQRGFLKIIVDDKKKVSIQRMQNYSENKGILSFEKELLDGLFSKGTLDLRKIDDLKTSNSFYTAIENFKKKISQDLVDENLFSENPLNTQTFYSVISVLGFMTINIFLGIVALFFGRKSAKRTDLGIEKYSEAMSLKNFLVSQDAQMNFQSQNQMFFEKLLPYATAFGVEKVWANRFEGLKLVKPDWYEGDVTNLGTITAISSSLNSGIRSNSSYMSSTRSSSGFSSGFSGGHSGGGGGGGSTGSW